MEHHIFWEKIKGEIYSEAKNDPNLKLYVDKFIFSHKSLADFLGECLSEDLNIPCTPRQDIVKLIKETISEDTTILDEIIKDVEVIYQRDPACYRISMVFFYSKGFYALCTYRISNGLWKKKQSYMAVIFQSAASKVYGADIHPAAKLGKGIFIDHATSIVIGETSIVEDGVSILHEVTLGGTGKISGYRHPRVRKNVLIGAGAKILGNVEIGAGAKIGAGSVVLMDVPPHKTAAGVPARVIGTPDSECPAEEMDHMLYRSTPFID